MEGLEVFPPAFVAEAEASEVAEAGEGSFDDVPQHAQAAAVGVVGAGASKLSMRMPSTSAIIALVP